MSNISGEIHILLDETEKYNRKNPHKYGQLLLDTDVKTIQWRMDSLFNKWCCGNWASVGKKQTHTNNKKTTPGILTKTTHLIKNEIKKKITDLNIKHKTIKILENV